MAAGSATIRELLVKLGVDVDDDKLDAFDASLEKAKGHAQDLVGFLAKVAAGVAAVAGAALYQASATAQSALAIERQAAALGLTTDAYQELLYASGRFGVEAGDLMDVFGQIAQLSSEAQRGNVQYTETFAQLGISVDQLRGKNPEQLFDMLAEGLGNTEDATTRLALASSILGEDSAKKLGPLLVKGSKGIAALRKEAHTLGVVMTEENIVAARELSDRTAKLGGVVTSLRTEIGMALIPGLVRVADKILAWYDANEDVIRLKIDEYATKITTSIDLLATAITRIDADKMAKLGETILMIGAGAGAGYAAVKVIGLASALWTMGTTIAAVVGPAIPALMTLFDVVLIAVEAGAGMAAFDAILSSLMTPLGWVALAVAAVVAELAFLAAMAGSAYLVFEDFYTFIQGGDSVLGRLVTRFGEANTFLGAMVRWWQALANLAGAVGSVMSAAIDGFVTSIQPAIVWAEAFGEAVYTNVIAALDAIAPYLDRITAGVNMLSGALGSPAGTSAARSVGSAVGGAASYATTAPLQTAASLAGQAASYAPRAAGGLANPTPAVNVGGDTITINVNSTTWREDVEQLVARISAQKARATAGALAGAEV